MKKILLYNSGGGLGDSIQLFNLILSLQNHFKSSNFFYLGAHENHFQGKLKEFNINIKSLDLGLKYFGFRWWHLFRVKKKIKELNLEKFDIIIDVQSKIRNTLILKQIPSKKFFSRTFNYKFSSNSNFNTDFKKSKIYSNNLSPIIQDLRFFLDDDFVEVSYSINMIDDKYHKEALRLLPEKNYIGFSLTQGNEYREKSWPLKNFIVLAKKIIESDKRPVFFIEKTETDLIKKIKNDIPQAIFPELNSQISCPALVTTLASRLENLVTIDNGIMHMVNLANIPMITLFGPTNAEKFSPKRKGVITLSSKKIYGSKNISKITVDDVLKELNFKKF